MDLKQLAKSVIPAPIWTRLRLLRLRHELRHFPAREVSHQYHGFPLTVHLADGFGKGWYDHDWGPLREIELLRTGKLKPGVRVFDLGAHQCVVGMILARIVGETGQVIAVEANEHNARVGEKNRLLNAISQMTILHAAAAEHSGQIVFNEGFNGQVDAGDGEWGRVKVPALSLDDLSERYGYPDVIFVDVEGYECAVLRGSRNTLSRRPDCFVEVHVNEGLEKFGGSAEEVAEFFPSASYNRQIFTEDEIDIVPYHRGHPKTNRRFFLVAIAK